MLLARPAPTSVARVLPLPTVADVPTDAFDALPSRVNRAAGVHRVRVLPGVTVVIGHAKTLGEALAFVARAETYSGLTGVAIERDAPTDFEIFVGPFADSMAGKAFRASIEAKFRHVTEEGEGKSSDALKLTDLGSVGTTVGEITPVEAL